MSFEITRELVKAVLRSPFDLKWSVQGLGMLRTYLDDNQRYRLHVWDKILRVPDVSPIHDHPWHLNSLIVAGQLIQQRYLIAKEDEVATETLQMVLIKCGEGACTKTDPVKTRVYGQIIEVYTPGESYAQRKDEIHETRASDGTVTIVDRTFEGDRDTARVFWRGEGG